MEEYISWYDAPLVNEPCINNGVHCDGDVRHVTHPYYYEMVGSISNENLCEYCYEQACMDV